jgi:hypothetical protein
MRAGRVQSLHDGRILRRLRRPAEPAAMGRVEVDGSVRRVLVQLCASQDIIEATPS